MTNLKKEERQLMEHMVVEINGERYTANDFDSIIKISAEIPVLIETRRVVKEYKGHSHLAKYNYVETHIEKVELYCTPRLTPNYGWKYREYLNYEADPGKFGLKTSFFSRTFDDKYIKTANIEFFAVNLHGKNTMLYFRKIDDMIAMEGVYLTLNICKKQEIMIEFYNMELYKKYYELCKNIDKNIIKLINNTMKVTESWEILDRCTGHKLKQAELERTGGEREKETTDSDNRKCYNHLNPYTCDKVIKLE